MSAEFFVTNFFDEPKPLERCNICIVPHGSEFYYLANADGSSFVVAKAQLVTTPSDEPITFVVDAATEKTSHNADVQFTNLHATKDGFVSMYNCYPYPKIATINIATGRAKERVVVPQGVELGDKMVFLNDNFYYLHYGDIKSYNVNNYKITTLRSGLTTWDGEVYKFDDSTLLITSSHANCYLFDLNSNKLSLYPMVQCIPRGSFCIPIGERYLIFASGGELHVLNKTTRQLRVYKIAFTEWVGHAYLLPKQAADTHYKVLYMNGTSINMLHITESIFQEPEMPTGLPDKSIMNIVCADSQTIPIHSAVVAARLKKALQNSNLLDWSFAPVLACKKVVHYLYTDDILVHKNSKDLPAILKIAKHIKNYPLFDFCAMLQNGDDEVINQIWDSLNRVYKFDSSELKRIKVPGINEYFDAVSLVTTIRNKEAESLQKVEKALKINPRCILFERLQKEVFYMMTKTNDAFVGQFEKDVLALVGQSVASDIKFKIGDKFVPAHLYFLFKSPFVKNLMDIEEQQELEINLSNLIPEVSEHVFTLFLQFAYTSTVPSLSKETVQVVKLLLHIACFFGIAALSTVCEKQLVSVLKQANAAELLEFGLQHDCTMLISKSQQLASTAVAALQANQQFTFTLCTEIDKKAWMKQAVRKFIMQQDAYIDTNAVPCVTKAQCFSIGSLTLNQPLLLSKSTSCRIQLQLKMKNCMTETSLPEFGVRIMSNFSDVQSRKFGVASGRNQLNSYRIETVPHSCETDSLVVLQPGLFGTVDKSVKIDIAIVPAHLVYSELKSSNLHLVVFNINGTAQTCSFVPFTNSLYYVVVDGSNYLTSQAIQLSDASIHVQTTFSVPEWFNSYTNVPMICLNQKGDSSSSKTTKCGATYTIANNLPKACASHAAYASFISEWDGPRADSYCTTKWDCCGQMETVSHCKQCYHGCLLK